MSGKRPWWLIQADVLRDESEALRRAIRRQGMSSGMTQYEPFASGYLDRIDGHALTELDCVIFRGNWPMWRHIQLRWPEWRPAGWCNTENLDCATYYTRFATFLLNRDHVMLRGAEAIAQADAIFKRFGKHETVFVRPAGCNKLFTGRCVDRSSFPAALAPARYDPSTCVMIAAPRVITREWRVVIAEGEPIAASQYLAEGTRAQASGCPSDVTGFVQAMLAKVSWQPDDVFMMDICEADGVPHLLELNGFSCAGLYQCDLDTVVERVSAIAERAWASQCEKENVP